MQFKISEEGSEVWHTLDITDGPTLPKAWDRKGRHFRVTKIKIRYGWNPARKEWETPSHYINLTGPILLQDGSDGRQVAGTPSTHFQVDTAPEWAEWAWLRGIIDTLRPDGPPSFADR